MTQFYYHVLKITIIIMFTSNICSMSARLLACFLEFKNSFALLRSCADIIFEKFCCTAAIFVLKRICQTDYRKDNIRTK